jgi:alkylhydroperoxidase/carboxymuconolactone decarboxylase family protein YurZ
MPTRHDQLAAAWEQLARAGRNGPLDERTCRMLELAVALGARDRDAVRAAHARLVEMVVFPEELDQLIALAAATIGKPATLAAYGWLGLSEPGAPRGGEPPENRAPKPSDA